jgi:hypothetical protein
MTLYEASVAVHVGAARSRTRSIALSTIVLALAVSLLMIGALVGRRLRG